ncbi:MAG: tetratricopeptide repeat protein, partial [Acidobacteria bacterium]|nr:tetratricopeptide repeat protein [Acidobacteriota bacterium]
DYATLLAALLSLLIGLATGKAWERYKLRDGRWIDRRRARESPHYILGLNFLVANQIDLAIEELSRARLDTDALEIHMILGNLYREKGQVGRAIHVHQSLLQRPKLNKLEHAYVLLCLGLDFKRGGFVDRALEAFDQVLRLDPKNQYALVNLEKLYEEQHQWQQAYEIRQRLIALAAPEQQHGNQQIQAFLENELGLDALKRMEHGVAAQRFRAAIDLDPSTVPAYLNLGDVKFYEGQLPEAVSTWEKVLEGAPDRSHLVFDRLQSAYARMNTPDRLADLCRKLIAANPQDWRARLALSRQLANRRDFAGALDLLLEALVHNPHGLSIHHAIWESLVRLNLDPVLVDRYMELARRSVFYLDPHICLRCRYRSTELLWQCPHCHEWNSFVEERIASAKDGTEGEAV